MDKFRRLWVFFLPLLLLAVLTGQAGAAFKAVGPVDPVSTLPSWYQDTSNLALMPCLDQNGMCLLPPPFDPAFPPVSAITATPPVTDANFPGESFYYSAAALMPIEGGELANLAFVLEAAFLAGVAPNGGITFLRTDLQKMRNLAASSTYRVTHPYGTFQFSTDAAGITTGGGGVAVRIEDGPAVPADWFPPGFKAATNTGIGPYLTPRTGGFITDPVTGHVYIGNGTPIQVTGSPTGNNFFRVERLDALGVPVPGAKWETDLFALNGRVFTGPIPSDLAVTATYARDANSAQVDVFATALPGAVLTLSGTGITTAPLTPNTPSNGKYFLHIPLGTLPLPTGLLMTNSLDLQAAPPRPVTLVDEVNIFQSFYNPVANTLTIKAASRDQLSPPILTVPAFTTQNNTLDATGTIVLTPPAGTIPPTSVQVVSSAGGSATAPVSVFIPPPPPVAVNDSAATVKNSAIAINVLANDTADGGINPATVAVVTQPASGATAVANANGAVTYTPVASFTGSETFTYTFKDFFSQTSNTATVTVTVHAPPVAGNDTASAVVSSTVNIDVIANDFAFSTSINSTTVNIVSAASCGSTAVLANGTVNFTAPATTGTCSFSYVVSDTFVPAVTSNVATVTVVITPPPVPAPATGVTVSANLASPEAAQGTQIAVIASGSGGSGSYEYSYWLFNGTSWSETRPYSTTSNWTWDTTGLATGVIYTIAVNVRNVGSTAPFEAVAYRSIKLNPTAISLLVTANTPSPQLPGTAVTFSAAASGSSGNYAYQFYLFNGTSWTLVRDFSSLPTWTWDSTGLPAGDYLIGVNVLNSSLVGTVANGYFSYTLTTPVAGLTVISDQPSPHPAGTPVKFAASGTGGSGHYEYEFNFFNGTSWSLVQTFSGTDIWTLPATTPAGNYTIGVNVRNAGATNASDAAILLPYVVQ